MKRVNAIQLKWIEGREVPSGLDSYRVHELKGRGEAKAVYTIHGHSWVHAGDVH
mgnify:CR=1 FL=1